MRRNLKGLLGLCAVILAAVGYVGNIQATPSSGFSASTISVGRLAEFDVTHHLVSEFPVDPSSKPNVWLSLQKTKGPSDLYVQNNVWQVGGTTGWHTHPGHSLVTVTSGTLTNYHGDDPSCTPTVYTAGTTFVDPGGLDHAHLVRNEGIVEARTTAVQLIPAGATRRINVDGNPACPF